MARRASPRSRPATVVGEVALAVRRLEVLGEPERALEAVAPDPYGRGTLVR